MRNDERDRMDRDARNLDGTSREMVEGQERLTLSEEELAIRKDVHRAGEVDVRKTVETEHVRESVPVSHEEVVIERRPATPGMHAAGTIGEDEIRVPVSREELSADKRVVAKEELVVRKREVVENEVVDADLRRERAEISRQGDVEVRDEGFRADDTRNRPDRI